LAAEAATVVSPGHAGTGETCARAGAAVEAAAVRTAATLVSALRVNVFMRRPTSLDATAESVDETFDVVERGVGIRE
jgi:hypothetical protein